MQIGWRNLQLPGDDLSPARFALLAPQFADQRVDEFDTALELLKKAEVLTERHRGIRAVTYNNLGCFYRK